MAPGNATNPAAPWAARLGPQLTAFFTSAAIFASSAAVSFLEREGGRPHVEPQSRPLAHRDAEGN
jgi:hypothetical protein